MKKEYNFSKMKAVKNPYASKKKAVGINLSHEVIDYFKKLSGQTGISYQVLIDLYLLDCVKTKKKPKFDWAA
jgi:predicted DNA binding CopG/RHH family protein